MRPPSPCPNQDHHLGREQGENDPRTGLQLSAVSVLHGDGLDGFLFKEVVQVGVRLHGRHADVGSVDHGRRWSRPCGICNHWAVNRLASLSHAWSPIPPAVCVLGPEPAGTDCFSLAAKAISAPDERTEVMPCGAAPSPIGGNEPLPISQLPFIQDFSMFPQPRTADVRPGPNSRPGAAVTPAGVFQNEGCPHFDLARRRIVPNVRERWRRLMTTPPMA